MRRIVAPSELLLDRVGVRGAPPGEVDKGEGAGDSGMGGIAFGVTEALINEAIARKAYFPGERNPKRRMSWGHLSYTCRCTFVGW